MSTIGTLNVTPAFGHYTVIYFVLRAATWANKTHMLSSIPGIRPGFSLPFPLQYASFTAKIKPLQAVH
ncbi:hypothetical protein [Aliiroseovarius sp. F47248L]|uniref:hypothetical protein n=1 Tax=Aliiroseovarius sp. F47248L TaxID=2926420 RepID=UPI001FF2D7CC|nr:hypothetical protein [Aliiroseovarius sp. F47248L]MCK0139891.1 hypothetical protein [Aliiroseovarius sp. F47248L]